MNFLHGSNASLTNEMDIQEVSSSALSTATHDSEFPRKDILSAPDS